MFATTLFLLYFLLPPSACRLMFPQYQPIDPLILYLGLPWPIYNIFTSYHFYGLSDHHSYHVNPFSLPLYSLGFLSQFTPSLPLFTPMGLLLNSLGFLGPFTSSLPLVTFMGPLAINVVTSAYRACFLISLPFCPLFSSYLPYCWVSSTIGPSVKNGPQQS